jgi:hypothetical protein
MPNAMYKGQKLIKLVKINIPDIINPTIASVTLIKCVKYNSDIIKANSILMILSVLPIFFFIILVIFYNNMTVQKNEM